jgi:hypothetical protein
LAVGQVVLQISLKTRAQLVEAVVVGFITNLEAIQQVAKAIPVAEVISQTARLLCLVVAVVRVNQVLTEAPQHLALQVEKVAMD